MYGFSNFWWGFEMVRLLAWPGYLPITLVEISFYAIRFTSYNLYILT